jgi:hypothetical protein
MVRTPSRLPPEAVGRVAVHAGDLSTLVPVDLVGGREALINCAGHGADGAALLDLDSSGRRGVDRPRVRSTYWPHAVNVERLSRSRVDWPLLCPGPMVDDPALGLHRMRVSVDALPVPVPGFAPALPGLLLLSMFASRICRLPSSGRRGPRSRSRPLHPSESRRRTVPGAVPRAPRAGRDGRTRDDRALRTQRLRIDKFAFRPGCRVVDSRQESCWVVA